MKLTAPLDIQTADDLFDFWADIFGCGVDPDLPKHVFTGSESSHNRNVVYIEKENGVIAATCGITAPLKISDIGGFGEVATDPSFRRKGLATKLSNLAVNDFRTNGGEALFLGTGNPEAARIYHRLGWRKISGASVMVNITSNKSPEEYLVERFGKLDSFTVGESSPIARIPMIPLLINPHDWHVLDANAGMFSTRYDIQNSCMGLYRRYSYIKADGNGEWFTAATNDEKIVGISSALLLNKDVCQIDGFSHKRFQDCWSELIDGAIKWACTKGVSRVCAKISIEDEEKNALFSGMGFTVSNQTDKFEYGEREIESVELLRDVR